MKPPRFDYADPRTLGEAVALLQQHEGEAKLLSGGQVLSEQSLRAMTDFGTGEDHDGYGLG